MKIIVTGGRNYVSNHVARVLDDWHNKFLTDPNRHPNESFRVIHGGCSGADAMAQMWADRNGVLCDVYEANWKKHGKAAGPIRNRQMLEYNAGATVVAFPGGRGTSNMVSTAKSMGFSVYEYSDEEATQ